MLAMMSVLLLQAHLKVNLTYALGEQHIPKFAGLDYFSLTKNVSDQSNRSASSGWSRRPLSPAAPQIAASLSSSTSSRGSWSSLFNTGTMRQFMAGVQDTLKEGLATPLEIPESSIPVPPTDGMNRVTDSTSPVIRRRRPRKDSMIQSPATTSKSWNESLALPPRTSTSFSSAGHRRTPLTQVTDPGNITRMKRVLVFDPPPPAEKSVTIV